MTAMRSRLPYSFNMSIAHQSASDGTVSLAFSKSHVRKSTSIERIFADSSMKRSLSSRELRREASSASVRFFLLLSVFMHSQGGDGNQHSQQLCAAQLS